MEELNPVDFKMVERNFNEVLQTISTISTGKLNFQTSNFIPLYRLKNGIALVLY